MEDQEPSNAPFAFQPDQNKLDSLAEFAAGIGHELNNPLAIINGRVQLLSRQTKDVQTLRDLAEIQAAVFRAAEMIADIRLFACPPEPNFQKTDLADVLNQLTSVFTSYSQRQSVALAINGTGAPFWVDADASQLAVLFQAIVRNSYEAIGENGTVAVTLSPNAADGLSDGLSESLSESLPDAGACCIVTVEDNGPGLSPYEAEHAFDPYFSARQANRGLGFGLCKAYRIVQMCNGRILIQSKPGVGTTVQTILPICQKKPE